MRDFLDELERNTAIKGAKANLELGASADFVIKWLMISLKISEQEAISIFDNEVKETA